MKKFLILILILLLPVVVRAGGLLMLGGQTPTAGGGGISDDFSGDLSKWTQSCGISFTVGGGTLNLGTTGTNSAIRYSAATTATDSQWIKMKIITLPSSGNVVGFILRSANTDNSLRHMVLDYNNAGSPQWYWAEYTGCTHTTYRSATSAYTFTANHYYGVMMETSGGTTTIWLFDWASDPGPGPWDKATDIGAASPLSASTTLSGGLYVGVFSSMTGSVDDFSAGSYTP